MSNFSTQFNIHLKRCLPNKKDIVWLLLIAMLYNALLPATATSSASNISNKVLMCTSSGYQWLEVGSDAADKNSTPHCPLCVSSEHDLDLLSSNQSGLSLVNTDVLYVSAPKAQLFRNTVNAPRVRAPPISL